MTSKPKTAQVNLSTLDEIDHVRMPETSIEAGKKVKITPGKYKTNVTLYLSLYTHNKLKERCFTHNTSIQQIMNEALDLYFLKYGMDPLVRPEPPKDGAQ